MLPVFGARDYLAQFQRLLPRGRIWHRGEGRVMDADLFTLMPTWARLHRRLNDLIAEIFPCSTHDLLPEWEDTLGLPDPCIGVLDGIQQRVMAVCAKFTARGGQSKPYYIAVGQSLGMHVQITEFSPFRCGHNSVGDPLCGEQWAHAWQITAATSVLVYFRTGVSTMTEPLRYWGNRIFECIMESIKPAHTILHFAYVVEFSPWDRGDSDWDGGDSKWDNTA